MKKLTLAKYRGYDKNIEQIVSDFYPWNA